MRFFLFRPDPGTSTRIQDDHSPSESYANYDQFPSESYGNNSEDEYHPSPHETDSELESENELQAASFGNDKSTET